MHLEKRNKKILLVFIRRFGLRLFRGIVASLIIIGILLFVFLTVDTGRGLIIKREFEKIDYSHKLRDPTYQELREFLINDPTSSRKYIMSNFNIKKYACVNFAVDVKKNAIKQGIRCAGVLLKFRDNRSHALVAFKTVDKGTVFIEPQTDEEVLVVNGLSYLSLGIIKSAEIYWPRIKNN